MAKQKCPAFVRDIFFIDSNPMKHTFFQTTPECEITSCRIVDFPQALVYQAWTNPDHLKNWWGPKGFTNTFHEFDLREGGHWRFTMHAPEKGNFENHCEFVKIDTPNLIAWKRHSQPLFKVAASFESLTNQQTKIVFRMVFDSPEACNKLKGFVVDKNEENFDRLESELAKMSQ
jgi:uncharacterized protein YndB with AHSA1/START domain